MEKLGTLQNSGGPTPRSRHLKMQGQGLEGQGEEMVRISMLKTLSGSEPKQLYIQELGLGHFNNLVTFTG